MPMNGIDRWVWLSISPGSTKQPLASITDAPSGAATLPTAAIDSPSMRTSPANSPSAVTTVPLAMSVVSVIAWLLSSNAHTPTISDPNARLNACRAKPCREMLGRLSAVAFRPRAGCRARASDVATARDQPHAAARGSPTTRRLLGPSRARRVALALLVGHLPDHQRPVLDLLAHQLELLLVLRVRSLACGLRRLILLSGHRTPSVAGAVARGRQSFAAAARKTSRAMTPP